MSQYQTRAKEIKKAIYAIGNVIKKDLSKNIREFEKLLYGNYEERSPNMSLLTVTFT